MNCNRMFKLRYFVLALLLMNACRPGNKVLETKIDLSDQGLVKIPDSVFSKTNLTALNLGAKEVTFYPPLTVVRPKNTNRIVSVSKLLL
jgi:hypothetical protein